MSSGPAARRRIRVRGVVQGVGFRPTVYRLARAEGLSGFVRNDGEGVWIEVEGRADAVTRFPALLRTEAPPLSRIAGIESSSLVPLGESGFRVVESARAERAGARIPVDVATCDACLRELLDPADRRHRYPFVNCTDCGPRYTIVREVPYDRSRTTMRAFPLCAGCRAEYEDPSNRRFHAEPNACPECGPRLEWRGSGRPVLLREDALRAAALALRGGRTVAVKGLGGFFLAVDARDEVAVARLRERKRRPHKPFALMARDLAEIRRVAHLEPAAERALLSPARPIVLLPSRPGAVAPSVAPGLSELGVMLPYTPLHHLLLGDAPPLLVMTSGNLSEEPIAREDAEAVERLSSVADGFLLHDRDVHTRVDDSVLRLLGAEPRLVRRARGYVPDAIALGFRCPPVLAVGAELKSTVCLARDGEAFLSQHIGDLENARTYRFFEEVIEKLRRLLSIEPAAVAHDLHPDYLSTRWALASGLPRIPVQHHHAHVASCLAEHGRRGPALGVAFDGTGCGPDGDVWGGELLLADLAAFRRLAHLRAVALPGGDAAIREPWRIACAALLDAGEPLDALRDVEGARLGAVARLVARRVASPLSTGAGRWFDAIAALCGVRGEVSYEGQAAVELEAIAAPGSAEAYPFDTERDDAGVETVDLRPMVRAVAGEVRRGVGAAVVSARFHETVAQVIVRVCCRAREAVRVATVALSGGCFQNRRLAERAQLLLEQAGFEVLVHRLVPPNDGGIALGQAAVAAFRMSSERQTETEVRVPCA